MFTIHLEGPAPDEKTAKAVQRAFANAVKAIRLAMSADQRAALTGGASGHVNGESFSTTVSEMRIKGRWRDA